jgi:hypothetical protein
MPNLKELYKITHSSPELETVGDFLNDRDSIANTYKDDPERFLNIVGSHDHLTNRQRIEQSYFLPADKRLIGSSASKLPLKIGTLLYVEYDKINELSFVTEGIEVVNTDEPAFKAARLAELEGDKGYVSVNKLAGGKLLGGSLKQIFPECTVWIWCRALSPTQTGNNKEELTGQFFDLTPFILRCSTNMARNGGNFNIALPPLVCELDNENKWILKQSNISRYVNKNATSIQGEGYVAQSSLFHAGNENGDQALERNQFLFHNIISSNDLIFIRFETLDMEKNQRYQDAQNYYVSKANIANKIYDMIGLVDSNTQSINAASNDVTTVIQGRDLSKLFIEDGTYFYALENSQGMLKFAGQSELQNSQLSRIFGTGALNFISLYMHSSIQLILKFIIQQLSNIKIVPDGLFSSYGSRINAKLSVIDQKSTTSDYKPQYKYEPANGIWKIIKLVIDESVSKRRIQDSSFSSAQGSLMNFIHTVAQQPLVELYMDTYGDEYNIIVRKPPTDQKALVSLLEGKVNTENGLPNTPPAVINIEQEDVLSETLAFDDSQVYSWYHFFPQNNFFGDSNSYSLTYLGALFFEEYAQIWGSKPFQQSHPYVPFVSLNNSEKGLSLYEGQAIEDLKYVVESNQYLPFTRKGTIVVNRDRRIKIGNIIRYKSTGEIFFVDAVQQTFQITEQGIDATTTLQVSRGMIEQLIYGVNATTEGGEQKFVSYFNIIDTRLEFKEKDIITKVEKRRKVASTSDAPAVAQVNELSSPVGNFFTNLITPGIKNEGVFLLEKYNKYPNNKNLFIRFIQAINNAGYSVIITSTNRSFAEQAAEKLANSNNASPGHSRHEVAAAIDIKIKNIKTGVVHGKNTPKEAWIATGIPALAKVMGLQWAGGDGSFGSYVDRVHFQIIGKADELVDIYENYTEDVKSKAIDRDSIFSNFKVNKYSFNFFLKKRQFDPAWMKVTNRMVRSSDAEGTLQTVEVIGKKKKK